MDGANAAEAMLTLIRSAIIKGLTIHRCIAVLSPNWVDGSPFRALRYDDPKSPKP
jgi:hypothetical protein